jgi:hypothetical protein
MNSHRKTPPIINIGAWLLALCVFGVGFWHTHLGLKEMKPFGSEWGGLVIATIVLLLLLITYWFAVNGKKLALIFYILCGIIFFVCNLNYFYPSYMARTLIQNEASALNDTLQKYTNGTASFQGKESSPAVKDYLKLSSLKEQIVTEISNKGFGPNARKLTDVFNGIITKYSGAPISISYQVGSVTSNDIEADRQRKQIEPLFTKALENMMAMGVLNVNEPIMFAEGLKELTSLRSLYTTILEGIAADNVTQYKIDSIKTNYNVLEIKLFVNKLNTIIDKINKSQSTEIPILNRLEPDIHPRADKLGMIKYTLKSIQERINEIDTWAIIILCLFIDLIVPLAIYLLLRKKDGEAKDKSLQGKMKPSTF